MAKKVECARCKGKGSIREGGLLGPGPEKKCPVCGGSGKVDQK
jgi:DnaJ-class molecular chaperone